MPLILGLVLIVGFFVGATTTYTAQSINWKNSIIEGTVVVEEPEYAPPVVYSCKLLTTQDEKL